MFAKLFSAPFSPKIFSNFFDSGMSEDASPILSHNSRSLSRNLSLKSASLSLLTYIFALLFHFLHCDDLSALLIVFTFFIAGTPALIKSLKDLQSKTINIDILMTSAAFGSIFIDGALEGALLLVLFAISESLGLMVASKARSTLASLKNLAPTIAWVVQEDGTLKKTPVNQVSVGSIIRTKSGEVVPLDGEIVQGASSINLSHLTGEKTPKSCGIGSVVPAGAHNLEGSFDLKVLRTGANSTIAHIIHLVVQAQSSKPALQQRLDRYSSIYAISIFVISAAMIAFIPVFTPIPLFGSHSAFYRALAFLIAASPCALIIAIPIAYLSTINACAKRGVLLKGGNILDRLVSCKAIVMDKTGTLTSGELTCVQCEHFGTQEADFYACVLALEQSSFHPIAQAIVSFITRQGITPTAVDQFWTIPGEGVKGTFQDEEIFIGKVSSVLAHIPPPYQVEIADRVQLARERGDICSLACYKGHYAIFYFRDMVRPEAKGLIQTLNSEGFPVIMLTGDHHISAKNVAEQVGIQEVYSDLSPKDKLNKIRDLAIERHILMIGDGINDAPALAQATVGVAMGEAGSATAIEAADVVLLHDSLIALPWMMRKARQTRRIVSQNLCIALAIILCISWPASLGIIPLWLAVILHEGSTVIVGLNALRLLKN